MKKPKKHKSNCCKADIVWRTGVSKITYAECSECGKPCGFHISVRREWEINPSTKIIPDKREKIIEKQTQKEIKENE